MKKITVKIQARAIWYSWTALKSGLVICWRFGCRLIFWKFPNMVKLWNFVFVSWKQNGVVGRHQIRVKFVIDYWVEVRFFVLVETQTISGVFSLYLCQSCIHWANFLFAVMPDVRKDLNVLLGFKFCASHFLIRIFKFLI